MFFTIAARRTRRVMKCLGKATVCAFSASTPVTVLAFSIYGLFTDKRSITFSDAIMLMLTFSLIGLILFFFLEVRKYGMKIFHRFDEDIIGGAFTGLDQKSARFEAGVHTFHGGDFRGALDIFTDLDSDNLELSNEEQGVLSFYRGRCYQIMGIYPNAEMCYEKAEENGFKLAEMPLFRSRCYAQIGDTRRAVEILMDIMDTDHRYSRRARLEIGNIYMKLDNSEEALKWFSQAIEKHESYAEALGGAAICYNLQKNFQKGEEYYRMAMLNQIEDPHGFTDYYKQVQAAVMLGSASSGPKSES